MTRSAAFRLLLVVELAAAVGSIALGVWLAIDPSSNVERYLGISASIFVLTGLLHRFGDKILRFEGKDLSPTDRLHHREKMREQFEAQILSRRRGGLAYEVIIRHVNRADKYPEIDEKEKGISPWFKTEMIETYHRGIRVLLRIQGLCVCPDGYRLADYSIDGEGDEKGFLFGHIPYDSIEVVNWDGDEYYNSPIIYCHFDHNGEPYEELIWDKLIGSHNGFDIYQSLADYQSVRLNTAGHK